MHNITQHIKIKNTSFSIETKNWVIAQKKKNNFKFAKLN